MHSWQRSYGMMITDIRMYTFVSLDVSDRLAHGTYMIAAQHVLSIIIAHAHLYQRVLYVM